MTTFHKDRLIYDPADEAESDQIGVYLQDGAGNALTSTTVGGSQALDVNIVAATGTGVYAEDSAHVTADKGQFTLAVRNDANTSLVDTDGDYAPFQVNALGRLKVDVTGTVDPTTAASWALYAEDAAHSSGAIGQFVMGVRNDAGTTLAGTDGDYIPFSMDSSGRLRVAADIDIVTGHEKAEDAAHASGDIGSYVLTVRQDTLASSTSADGDYASFKVDSRGGMWTVPVGSVADDAVDNENPVKIGMKAKSGSLTAVSASGDRADATSDLYRRLFVNTSAGVGLLTATATVGATAALLVATPLAGRRQIIVSNTSSNDIFVGDSGVTTANGIRIAKGTQGVFDFTDGIALYAIAAGAGNTVRILEVA